MDFSSETWPIQVVRGLEAATVRRVIYEELPTESPVVKKNESNFQKKTKQKTTKLKL